MLHGFWYWKEATTEKPRGKTDSNPAVQRRDAQRGVHHSHHGAWRADKVLAAGRLGVGDGKIVERMFFLKQFFFTLFFNDFLCTDGFQILESFNFFNCRIIRDIDVSR